MATDPLREMATKNKKSNKGSSKSTKTAEKLELNGSLEEHQGENIDPKQADDVEMTDSHTAGEEEYGVAHDGDGVEFGSPMHEATDFPVPLANAFVTVQQELDGSDISSYETPQSTEPVPTISDAMECNEAILDDTNGILPEGDSEPSKVFSEDELLSIAKDPNAAIIKYFPDLLRTIQRLESKVENIERELKSLPRSITETDEFRALVVKEDLTDLATLESIKNLLTDSDKAGVSREDVQRLFSEIEALKESQGLPSEIQDIVKEFQHLVKEKTALSSQLRQYHRNAKEDREETLRQIRQYDDIVRDIKKLYCSMRNYIAMKTADLEKVRRSRKSDPSNHVDCEEDHSDDEDLHRELGILDGLERAKESAMVLEEKNDVDPSKKSRSVYCFVCKESHGKSFGPNFCPTYRDWASRRAYLEETGRCVRCGCVRQPDHDMTCRRLNARCKWCLQKDLEDVLHHPNLCPSNPRLAVPAAKEEAEKAEETNPKPSLLDPKTEASLAVAIEKKEQEPKKSESKKPEAGNQPTKKIDWIPSKNVVGAESSSAKDPSKQPVSVKQESQFDEGASTSSAASTLEKSNGKRQREEKEDPRQDSKRRHRNARENRSGSSKNRHHGSGNHRNRDGRHRHDGQVKPKGSGGNALPINDEAAKKRQNRQNEARR